MNGRLGFAVLVFCGLLSGAATVARACDRFSAAAVFAVPQPVAVLSAVPLAVQAQAVATQAVVVQNRHCFVPSAVAVRAFNVQSFGGVRAAASTGFGGASSAVAGGGRYRRSRAVSSSGGLFGFLPANPIL